MSDQQKDTYKCTDMDHVSQYAQQGLASRRGAVSEQGGRSGGQIGHVYGPRGEGLGQNQDKEKK